MKKRVYVESSVISYLAARPANNIILLGRQRMTMTWWERRREWDLCLSRTVLEEIAIGDANAAVRRLEFGRILPVLPALPEAEKLANSLVAGGAVPAKAFVDALHISIAALHKVDYLLTWNQKHLDNLNSRYKIEQVIREQGLSPVMVLTPEKLLEEQA